ncbi:4-hydroxyphenylpyruvate dioxygenase [hydrothermal vent metagenome]|uniref:4-hydroxyphenylpyruvate dioxygenase n=1 Tax=hydrothermal vent metagenome TaxID=652676 RepID=A0A3B0VC10_9ZZZZ
MTNENSNVIHGFGFIEYASNNTVDLDVLFRRLGFSVIKKHKNQDITLYRQGGIDFFLNNSKDSFAQKFCQQHGPCANGFSIVFDDADAALKHAIDNGSELITGDLDLPAVKGIGGAVLYLLDKDSYSKLLKTDFIEIDGVNQQPTGWGMTSIDHLTHNVFYGNMEKWGQYYIDLFQFEQIRYFDIKGKHTGLTSKAMKSPNASVMIPLNESPDKKSQINEYIEEYNGEGIQHIALYTDNIYETIESIRAAGVDFLVTPSAYYTIIDQRVSKHSENVTRLEQNSILIDADEETGEKILLQIFTQNCIGPIFFEIIQRKGNEGFGEGNFQALFDSIELEQQSRGYL